MFHTRKAAPRARRTTPLGDDRGATSVEYALIATLLALSIIAGMSVAGEEVLALFQQIADGFN